MNASSKFAFAIAVCTAISLTFLTTNPSDLAPSESVHPHPRDANTARQDDDDEQDQTIPLRANDPDAVARRDFMRTKLMYTQNIFEGLTVGDFAAVDKAIKELRMITEGGQWVAIDNDTYRRLTDEFITSAKRLQKSAEGRNIEATALRFYEMSTRCIDCHQHLRKANYEL